MNITYVLLLLFIARGTSSEASCESMEGQWWITEGVCKNFTCLEDSKISGTGCRVFKLRAGCHMSPQDLSKPYPDCCPQPLCPSLP